jgi:2,4-dienoyl-CoA reductase-like NADH-dependent reductase (Old Yellow Enzyme family)
MVEGLIQNKFLNLKWRKKVSILFESAKIKNLELRNKFVRSATCDGRADRNGHVTENQIEFYSKLAEGGVGLIVTGIVSVHESSKFLPCQNLITSDDYLSGYKQLTDAVHEKGAKIAIQLYHAGRASALIHGSEESNLAPSYIHEDPYFNSDLGIDHFIRSRNYRAMSEDEIYEIIEAFGDAAVRARKAGFDAVQLHGAHGYLLSQFLSPFSNRRNDKWGGSLVNRLNFCHEIYKDIRNKVGEDFPLFIKLGVQDGFPGGLEFSEGKRAAQYMSEWGFDAFEISLGLRGSTQDDGEARKKINSVDQEAYYRSWCKEIKETVNVPVMMVGGLRSFELMEKVVLDREADFVSMSRPFISEPGLVNRWKNGDRKKAECISCNKCGEILSKGEPVDCVLLKG